MLHRFRSRATLATAMAALATFIGATAVAAQPAAALDTAPSPSAQWVFCTQEGGTCRGLNSAYGNSLTTQIRYGDYHIPWENSGFGNWSIQTRTGAVACTNGTFGDPFQYRQKQCEYDASGLRWHFCAHEGGTCELSSDQWVRYGSSDPYAPGPDTVVEIGWTVKKKSSTFNCTNDEFGGDPHYGYVKACWIYWR
jgi:hypothetical protein